MENKRKTLGVIGGLGPMSSVFFYELVTEKTKAEKDQDHLDIMISSRASTPDRTDFILGASSDSPLPVMIEEAKKLESCGVDVIALTCNTAHYFYESLQEAVNIPILNIGRLAVDFAESLGAKKVGLLATSGTVQSGIYQSAFEEKEMECFVPDQKHQQMVMEIIYDQVKSGKKADMSMLKMVSKHLEEMGAQRIILGCTELSVIRRDENLDERFIDPLEVLAETSIKFCGHELN